MYDIDELEKQWKSYRRKRMLLHGSIATAILLLLALPILYVSFKTAKPSSEEANPVVSQKTGKSREANRSTVSAETIGKTGASAPLTPEVPSMQNAEQEKKKPKMMITFSGSSGGTSGAESGTQGGKVEMQMVKSANRSVVQEIEKRFPMSRDYDDAMYLAKYYYGKKKYKKSENWAMQANSIDSSKPESWIIFGKSKAKMGHRRDALKVLQAYYDRTGNMEVKMLIDKIRKGKRF